MEQAIAAMGCSLSICPSRFRLGVRGIEFIMLSFNPDGTAIFCGALSRASVLSNCLNSCLQDGQDSR
ncbi:hypothetical protein D3C71_2080470 [compost metagenome]